MNHNLAQARLAILEEDWKKNYPNEDVPPEFTTLKNKNGYKTLMIETDYTTENFSWISDDIERIVFDTFSREVYTWKDLRTLPAHIKELYLNHEGVGCSHHEGNDLKYVEETLNKLTDLVSISICRYYSEIRKEDIIKIKPQLYVDEIE